MKTTLATTLLIALAFSVNPPANAADFEGRIDMKLSDQSSKNGVNGNMTYYVKPPKMRMEMTTVAPAGAAHGNTQPQNISATVIFNSDTREMTMFMPGTKMYLLIKDDTNGAATASSAKNADAYKPTGRADTILGYHAEEYAGTDSDGYKEMWLASGLGSFRMTASQDKKVQPKSWEQFAENHDFFPLKIIGYKKKGDATATYQLEVTKIEKGSQPDSLFVVPADYQLLDIGGMLGGIKDALQQSATAAPDASSENVQEKIKSSLFDRLKKLGQ